MDIRRGSPTFGRRTRRRAQRREQRQFWIPEGFAHGFVVLTERAVFYYLCTALTSVKPTLAFAGTTLAWRSTGR